MPRIVSATEAKTHMGAILDWAEEQDDEVIVQIHGQPKAVIISFAAYQKMRSQREAFRRQQALARLNALAERMASQNADLDQQKADALAEQFSRDVFAEMVAEGQTSYGR